MIEACEPRLQFFAAGLTRDPEEAHEIVQDVALHLHGRLERFGGGNFEAWLYRVTKNVFLDRYRRRRRRRDNWPESTAIGWAGSSSAEDEAMRSELRRAIESALMDLPDVLRTAVVLRDVGGLTYAEIARVMRTPTGTVRSRIHRGRERLRIALAPYVDGR